ncbi:zinc finger rad18 domain-containing protein [Stemphylium lycopersici]|uniref:Zinc finger rad18 domain-containing protein n=1 Tax=Stemphylium lycopersici TaxID=183478 RepID=A0A364N3T0_STELY|nr:zinc finger rad18 domain-containing protein [Stemphylium lycopersici]
MSTIDEHAALRAIATLERLSSAQQDALRAVTAIVSNGEPFVDVHELFALYDTLYFRALLLSRVQCAGICELSKDPESGKYTRIRLKLSTPLLQYRPRSDTINTLLHEAIHAYFFITTSWTHSRGDDGTGHGVGFQLLADAINSHGNYKVTIYHTFHDEVNSYRTHVWKCNGPCHTQPPFFGLVKRSMNRAPAKSDTWFAKHQAECGGTYTKIQEPAPTKKQLQAMTAKERAGRQKNKLDTWVTPKSAQAQGSTSNKPIDLSEDETPSAALQTRSGTGSVLGLAVPLASCSAPPIPGQKRLRSNQGHDTVVQKKLLVDCPICKLRLEIYDFMSRPVPKSYPLGPLPISSIDQRAPPLALIATCRIIHDEILAHFYTKVTFRAIAQSIHSIRLEGADRITLNAIQRAKKFEMRLIWSVTPQLLGQEFTEWPYSMSRWLDDMVSSLLQKAPSLESVTVSVTEVSEGVAWEHKKKMLRPLERMGGRVHLLVGEVIATDEEEAELKERLGAYLKELNSAALPGL